MLRQPLNWYSSGYGYGYGYTIVTQVNRECHIICTHIFCLFHVRHKKKTIIIIKIANYYFVNDKIYLWKTRSKIDSETSQSKFDVWEWRININYYHHRSLFFILCNNDSCTLFFVSMSPDWYWYYGSWTWWVSLRFN